VLHGWSTMVRLQLDERQWQKVKAALHHGPSVARLAGCLIHVDCAGSCAAARACLARATNPRPTSPHTADGNLRTVGHGHGHGHVYAEAQHSETHPRSSAPRHASTTVGDSRPASIHSRAYHR
jgi:hypothetical protein